MISSRARKPTQKRNNILIFNNGTYGDGAIMETVIRELKSFLNSSRSIPQKYNIIYVTNKISVLPDGTQPQHIFEFPEFVLNDPLLGPADSSQSLFDFVFNNAFNIKSLAEWSYSTVWTLKEMYEIYDPVGVIYNFSMIPGIFRANHEFPGMLRTQEVPTFIFYYAPGIPNEVTPWIYDGRLRKRNFQLYNRKHISNAAESWDTIINRSTIKPSVYSLFDREDRIESAVEFLGSINHLLAWPPSLVPRIQPANPKMRIMPVGYNMFTQTAKEEKNKKLPRGVLEFIQAQSTQENGKPLVFMSFGSFVKISHFRAIIPYLIRELVKTHAVIVHKTWKDADDVATRVCSSPSSSSPNSSVQNCYVHEGFIDYDKVIPYMSIVMGSGSYGLQTTCFKHRTPIIMVPIITEQYYWAKNFQHFTGVYYIDITDVYNERVEKQVSKALNTVYAKRQNAGTAYDAIHPRVESFLKQISREMHSRDPFKMAKLVMREIES